MRPEQLDRRPARARRRLSRRLSGPVALALAGLLACGSPPQPGDAALAAGGGGPPPDSALGGERPERSQTGLFLILAEAASPDELPAPAAGQRIARYDYKFLRAEARGEPEYFLLHREPDVPLLLAAPPRRIEGDRGLPELLFELTDEAAARMERVTRDNLGRTAALVIDGEVVTAHKIRAVIDSGRVQLSRCTDDACEYILARLQTR